MKNKQTQWLKFALLILIAAAAVFGAAQTPTRVTEAQGGLPLTYGSSATGAITANTPTVTYTFNGAAGDLVQIDVQSVSGTLNPNADLIGPDQAPVANGQYNRLTMRGDDAHLSAFLPQPGMYTIVVSGLDGTVGDYVLRLHGRTVMPSTPLQLGVALDVNIVQNAQPQYFTFEVGDCTTTLIITNLFDGEPFTFRFAAKVRNQLGQEMALLRGGDAREDRVTVPANSGRYEVEVFADDPNLMGVISLLITCAEDAPGCAPGGGGTGPTLARDPSCPPCPNCRTPFDPGIPGDVCPDMNPIAIVTDPEVRATTVTWNAVPGAEGYRIHIYGMAEGAEHYLGAAGAPGDATEFVFDHLWPDFYAYRFVIEALQGDVVICVGETGVVFTDLDQECPPMTLTGTTAIRDDGRRGTTFTWDAIPGVDEYFWELYHVHPDGSVEFSQSGSPGDLSPTQVSFSTNPDSPAFGLGYRLVLYIVAGDELICPVETTVYLEQPGCPDMNLQGEILDNEARLVHWSWNAYPDPDGYSLQLFANMGDGSAVQVGAVTTLPDMTTWDTIHPPGLADTDTYSVHLDVIVGDTLICPADATITFEPQGPDPMCANFGMGVTVDDTGSLFIEWTPYPEADGYSVFLWTQEHFEGDGVPEPGYPIVVGPEQTWYSTAPLVSGNYVVGVDAWSVADGVICQAQMMIMAQDVPDDTPCEVTATHDGVAVHVGPGRHRSVFTYLFMGPRYLVTGYNYAPDGSKWWQLDKTQFAGHEVVISLWVAEFDVAEYGNCVDIPEAEIPDIIPDDGGDEPGGWGQCGDCNTCGHPVGECITDPTGACVWDPTTCGGGDPDDPGDTCFRVRTAVDLGQCAHATASVVLDTPTNCEPNQYLPGTGVTAHLVVDDEKCHVLSWTGCGAGGASGNTITVFPGGGCTLTAHLGY